MDFEVSVTDDAIAKSDGPIKVLKGSPPPINHWQIISFILEIKLLAYSSNIFVKKSIFLSGIIADYKHPFNRSDFIFIFVFPSVTNSKGTESNAIPKQKF